MTNEEREMIARVFEDTVKKLTSTFQAELKTVRSELADLRAARAGARGEPGPAGRDGVDGKSVSVAEVEAMIVRNVAALPLRHGVDGKSVSVTEVMPLIEACVTRAVAKIPRPQDGVDGKAGKNGQDGASVTLADVTPMIESAVARHVSKIHVPQDGRHGKDGKDGASVTLTDVAPLIEATVKREVSKIPRPEDGRPGRDGKNGADGVSITPEEIKQIEQRLFGHVAKLPVPKDGKDGRDGKDGTSVDAAEVERAVTVRIDGRISNFTEEMRKQLIESLNKAVEEKFLGIKPPKDGRDGKDGASVTTADVLPFIQREIAAAVEKIPAPKDGRNGKDGRDGESVTAADVLPLIERAVAREAARIPIPRDGRDGQDGEHGRDAAQIEILTNVTEGKVYARGSYGMINGGLFFSDGREWKCVVDGVHDIEIEQVDERRFAIVHKLASGREKRHVLKVNSMLYKEVWKSESKYEPGDVVTWDGSMFVAMKQTNAKPAESTDWRLAVKRGRNGAPKE